MGGRSAHGMWVGMHVVHGNTMHRWGAVGAVMTEGMTLHMYGARRMLNDSEVWMGMRQ